MNFLALMKQGTAPETTGTEPRRAAPVMPPDDRTPRRDPPVWVVRPEERPPWNLDATTRYILALSEENRATYRAALAHDTAALARADAILNPDTETDP